MAFSGAANVLGDVTNDDGVIISSGGGPTTFFNDVVNDNEIRTSAGSFTVFFGSVTGAGTFTGTGTVNIEGDLSPGSSPGSIDFGGDVVLGASATLEIEIGGTTAGSEHDRIVVDGALELDGLLNVSRVNGFNPVVNDSFDILDWGSLNGAFDSITLPPLDGFVTWDTSNLYMTGVLAVVPLLPGDFNADGSVDAADYVVWRKGLGTTHTPDDFNVWRANFGNSLGSGSTAEIPPASVVPEPAAFVLIALGAVTMMGSGHRRSRRSRDYH
jgi:hypothetical protein